MEANVGVRNGRAASTEQRLARPTDAPSDAEVRTQALDPLHVRARPAEYPERRRADEDARMRTRWLDDRPWRGTRSSWVAKDPMDGHRRLVLAGDVAAVAIATVSAFMMRAFIVPDDNYSAESLAIAGAITCLIWLAALAAVGAYDVRVFEAAGEEYRRVLLASALVLGLVGTASFLLDLQLSRWIVLIELPLGAALLLVVRAVAGRRLDAQRRRGVGLKRALVVGEGPGSVEMATAIQRDLSAGLLVVDVVSPPAARNDLGTWVERLHTKAMENDVSAVVVLAHPNVHRAVVQAIAWRMEGPGVDLLVSPAFVAIGGPRITIRHTGGLPLIHLDEPTLSGPKRWVKRSMDITGALLALVLAFPVLAASAIAVRLSGPGPVLFRQMRIGAAGVEFPVFKFRTMVNGAQARQAEAWAAGSSNGMASKNRDDPRVTPVGRVLRRWSLDELPQLVNVLLGTMSLVGPRPLQSCEVDELPAEHDRRHLTKPGMTGLWQVSGRNELSWEERMRLDLEYVEHWSISLDVVILFRTIKAVLVGSGAY